MHVVSEIEAIPGGGGLIGCSVRDMQEIILARKAWV